MSSPWNEADRLAHRSTTRRRFLQTVGGGGITVAGLTQTGTAQATGGDEQWRFETGSWVWSSPAVVDGTVYVGSDDGHLYALDAVTGDEEWRFEIGCWVWSSPTVVDGTVYVGCHDNHVYALDAATGDEEWRFETGDGVRSSPTVVDGTVYIGSRDNHVYALDAASGDEEWRFETGGSVFSSPTVAGSTVFVGSFDNCVYALEASVDGSNEGSRISLGTLGHHQAWATDATTADGFEATPTPTPTSSPTPTSTPTTTPTPTPEPTATPTPADDDTLGLPLTALGIGGLLTVGGILAWWRRSGGGEDTATTDEPDSPSPLPGANYEEALARGRSAEQGGDRYFENDDFAIAAEEHETARDAYEEAIEIADEPDLDADEARSRLEAVEARIDECQDRQGPARESASADPEPEPAEAAREGFEDALARGQQHEQRADSLFEAGRYAEAHGTYETAREAYIEAGDLADEYDLDADEAEGALARLERQIRKPLRQEAAEELDTFADRVSEAEEDIRDGAYDDAVASLELALDDLDDLGSRAESHDFSELVADVADLRDRCRAALDAAETAQALTSDLEWVDDQLDDAHQYLDDGEYREAQDRFETLCEDLSELADRADELDLPELRSEVEALRKRCKQGQTTASEQLDARLIEDLNRRLDRASERLDEVATDVETESATDLRIQIDAGAETLDEVKERADHLDEADLDERIETLRQTIEHQRADVDVAEEIRDHVDDGHDRIDEALALVDNGTYEAAMEEIETVEVELDALADRACEREFDTLQGELEALGERSEYARERIEEAKRPGPPRSIPGAPDLDVSYQSLTRVELVGKGGNADVYLMETSNGEGLAVKEPRFTGTLHTETIERFMEEAETWDRLDDHEHVVEITDYGDQPMPWIAMEYMDGGHLGERLDVVELREALWIAISVTDAVLHAHRRGVAHLDLKPANILFRTTEGDDWDVPKVADWGLAKMLLEHSKSIEGFTPQYAAPEQVDDDRGRSDQVTDIYQVGAVFYELLTGEPPFDGRTASVLHKVLTEQPTAPTEVDPSLPEELDDVLLTALAKEKNNRYEDLLYLRDDLHELYEGL